MIVVVLSRGPVLGLMFTRVSHDSRYMRSLLMGLIGMILFYCSFVALKKQDQVKPDQDVDDYIQPGEVEEYSG